MAEKNYASLDQLKAWMSIGDGSQQEDALLTQALSSASRSIDSTTGRRFYRGDTAQARRYWPQQRAIRIGTGSLLLVDDIGADTDLTVEVGSTATGWAAVTDYETDPDSALVDGNPITGLLRTRNSWPYTRGTQVRITAKWGWPEVPAEVTQACLIQAGRLFRRKDSPEGVMGSSEWGPIRVSRVDPDVQALVQRLVLPGIA